MTQALEAKSNCRGAYHRTFWLRGSDQEVYRYEPEVIDLTQDDDDDDDDDDDNGFHRSTPDIAEAKQ